MLPILQALADQQGHALAQIRAQIASQLQLSHTAEESLARSYQRQRDALATELLDAIGKSSPAAFEGLVVDLLMATGYGGDQENAGWVVAGPGMGVSTDFRKGQIPGSRTCWCEPSLPISSRGTSQNAQTQRVSMRSLRLCLYRLGQKAVYGGG